MKVSDRYLGNHRLKGKLIWAKWRTPRLRVRRVRRQNLGKLGIRIWLECSCAGDAFNQKEFDEFGGIWVCLNEVCDKEDRWG